MAEQTEHGYTETNEYQAWNHAAAWKTKREAVIKAEVVRLAGVNPCPRV